MSAAARAQETAAAIHARAPIHAPVAGIILGSGLQGLADRIDGATRIPYAALPGFHASAVEGHRGELLHGTLAGREVVALAGRFHLYEGYSAATGGFPVRVLHALGIRTLLLSNAAGGIRRTFDAGDLMVIHDHLNLMFANPLTGAVEPGDTRFPDMSAPYSRRLITVIEQAARAHAIPLQSGVYAGLLGPTYETLAEVRMLERLGADATGMSTVPEVIVAAALGMEVAAISLISNKAAGLSAVPLSHAEVVEAGRAAGPRFETLISAVVAAL